MKITLFHFLLASLVLLQSSVVLADPFGWSNDMRLTFNNRSDAPSIAIDQDSNVHIIYRVYTATWYDYIYYMKLDNNGRVLINGTWIGSNGGPLAPAIDLQGNVHMVLANGWRRDLEHIKLNNTGGVILRNYLQLPSFNYSVPNSLSMGVDRIGDVHLLWVVNTNLTTYGAYYMKLNSNGSVLINETRLAISTYSYLPAASTSLSLDNEGNVHLFWDESDHQELSYTKLDNNGNMLVNRTIVAPGIILYPQSIASATDSQNNIHLTWVGGWMGMETFYKKLDNNGRNLTFNIPLLGFGGFGRPSLAVDLQGYVHIISSASDIDYIKLDNNGIAVVNLTQIVNLSQPYQVSDGVQLLAADREGNVHVVWGVQTWRQPWPYYDIYYKRSLSTSPPVLLVHGIYSDDRIWDNVERNLTREGWSVYRLGQVLNRPGFDPNNGPIRLLSYQLRDAIQRVKQQTGALKVTVVAHSMGGLVARFYIKSDLYRNDIDKLITLGTPNEGAPIAGNRAADLFGLLLGIFGNNTSIFGAAREEMTPNSEFLNELNSNYITRGIEHTEVAGTETSILIFLINQTSYLPFGRDTPTDSIVPRWSVNIPNIRCYQSNVTHTSTLGGTAYYDDQTTIDAVLDILRGQQPRLELCPPEGQDDPEPSNTIQVFTVDGLINRGEVQTAVQGSDLGRTFGALLNWNGAERLHLEFSLPSGVVINASNYRAFRNVSFSSGAFFNRSFEWFIFNVPEEGNWTINVSGLEVSSATNYVLTVFMEKSFAIELSTNKTNYQPQDIVVINARLTNDTLPVLHANVSATVTRPDTTTAQMILFDDGNHYDRNPNDGVYGNGFVETQLEGLYTIEADASKLDEFHLQDRTVFFVELFPDIYIDDSAISFEPPSLTAGRNMTVNVSAVIRNIGNKDAANVTVEFYDGHPALGGHLFGNVTTNVPINSSVVTSSLFNFFYLSNATLILKGVPRLNTTVNLSSIDTGLRAHNIHVIISPFSGFPESNYSNNVANKTLLLSDVTYVTALSFGTVPGIPLSDGRVIPLNFDILFLLSIQLPPVVGLQNNIGLVDASGRGYTTLDTPSIPELIGVTLYAGTVTISPRTSNPFISISNSAPITFIS